MTTLSCEQIRERLVDGDESAELLAHAQACAECAPILAALRDVDADLEAMTPIDAPDALVAQTLARVREEQPEAIESPSLLAAAFAILTSALGALVVAPVIALQWLLGVGTERRKTSIEDRGKKASRGGFSLTPALALGSVLVGLIGVYATFGVTLRSKTRGGDATVNGLPMPSQEEANHESWWLPNTDQETDQATERTDQANAPTVPAAAAATPGTVGWAEDGRFANDQQQAQGDVAGATRVPTTGATVADIPTFEGEYREHRGRDAIDGVVTLPAQHGTFRAGLDEDGDGLMDGVLQERLRVTRQAAADDNDARTLGPTGDTSELAIDQTVVTAQLGATGGERTVAPAEATGERAEIALRGDRGGEGFDLGITTRTTVTTLEPGYWDLAQATTGVAVASSQGWWANTYVPGDAQLRVLHARLAASTSPLAGSALSALALAELASPTAPAIAAPTDRALAIGVHADTTSIEGPTRVRMEIALRAIDQAAGRRGALRVALVVDARNGLGAEETEHLRSLLASLSHSLTPRDRVILTAAGPAGGTLVPLGVLRHGQVEVALRHLASSTTITGEAIPTSLEEALAAGLEAVAVDDDGAGLTLLVTPDGAHDAAVDQALHLGAVAGVPTTAVAIGTAASTSSLDAIALIGEGRRRVVLSDDDATRAVREELTAASRLVARALRVRIRLADGVQLVDVVGSHSLDVEETRRTRESERAIDQSLARRLGIGQDRDDDDSGVRILVPSFYAGDSHTIVLDLIVSRPGAVADVDVRFKDLVRLGNGTASSALALEAGTTPRGPRELRVVASYLGHEVSRTLDLAADAIERGDFGTARTQLTTTRALIDQARSEIAGLASVRSIATDTSLLDQFLAAVNGATDPSLVASSLHYAAARRIVIPQLQASSP